LVDAYDIAMLIADAHLALVRINGQIRELVELCAPPPAETSDTAIAAAPGARGDPCESGIAVENTTGFLDAMVVKERTTNGIGERIRATEHDSAGLSAVIDEVEFVIQQIKREIAEAQCREQADLIALALDLIDWPSFRTDAKGSFG
jgi:hypothetical protein